MDLLLHHRHRCLSRDRQPRVICPDASSCLNWEMIEFTSFGFTPYTRASAASAYWSGTGRSFASTCFSTNLMLSVRFSPLCLPLLTVVSAITSGVPYSALTISNAFFLPAAVSPSTAAADVYACCHVFFDDSSNTGLPWAVPV